MHASSFSLDQAIWLHGTKRPDPSRLQGRKGSLCNVAEPQSCCPGESMRLRPRTEEEGEEWRRSRSAACESHSGRSTSFTALISISATRNSLFLSGPPAAASPRCYG